MIGTYIGDHLCDLLFLVFKILKLKNKQFVVKETGWAEIRRLHNRCMKRCSTSLIVREIQHGSTVCYAKGNKPKTNTMGYHLDVELKIYNKLVNITKKEADS